MRLPRLGIGRSVAREGFAGEWELGGCREPLPARYTASRLRVSPLSGAHLPFESSTRAQEFHDALSQNIRSVLVGPRAEHRGGVALIVTTQHTA